MDSPDCLLILLSISVFLFFFTFYRAMLCIRGTSYGMGLCLSVSVLCLSQVGVLLKRLNIGSDKQHHTIALQGL